MCAVRCCQVGSLRLSSFGLFAQCVCISAERTKHRSRLVGFSTPGSSPEIVLPSSSMHGGGWPSSDPSGGVGALECPSSGDVPRIPDTSVLLQAGVAADAWLALSVNAQSLWASLLCRSLSHWLNADWRKLSPNSGKVLQSRQRYRIAH
jgi:hypothetical protein